MIHKSIKTSTEEWVGSLLANTALALNGNNDALKSTINLCNELIDEGCEDIIFKTVLLIAVAIDHNNLERKALQNSHNVNDHIKFTRAYEYAKGISNDHDFIELSMCFIIDNKLTPLVFMNELQSSQF